MVGCKCPYMSIVIEIFALAQSFLLDFHRLSRFEHQTGARMAETMKTMSGFST
jgi:hypothetical protein